MSRVCSISVSDTLNAQHCWHLRNNEGVQIRIEGNRLPGRDCGAGDNFPGYANIHVGVQSKNPRDELVGVHRGDAPSATWTLDCSADGGDIRGPQIHGRPGDRFVYLSWGAVNTAGHFAMFRRAKLMLAAVPAEVMTGALASGTLVGALGLTDTKGQPLCARVVPPNIHWSSR